MIAGRPALCAILISASAWMCVSAAGAADPPDGVGGRLEFKPQIPQTAGDAIDADILLYDNADSTTPIHVINVDHRRPYNFSYNGSSDLLQDAVKITCTIRQPSNYVCYPSSYRKRPGRPFQQIIAARTTDDAKSMLSAFAVSDPAAAVPELKFAQTWSNRSSQKLDLLRTLASIYGVQGDVAKQLDTLKDGAGVAATLSKQQSKPYWQERFDSLLISADYQKLKMPARDLGDRLEERPEVKDHWISFIKDFDKSYADGALKTDDGGLGDTAQQITAINKALGR